MSDEKFCFICGEKIRGGGPVNFCSKCDTRNTSDFRADQDIGPPKCPYCVDVGLIYITEIYNQRLYDVPYACECWAGKKINSIKGKDKNGQDCDTIPFQKYVSIYGSNFNTFENQANINKERVEKYHKNLLDKKQGIV